jgi:hypothetical protein
MGKNPRKRVPPGQSQQASSVIYIWIFTKLGEIIYWNISFLQLELIKLVHFALSQEKRRKKYMNKPSLLKFLKMFITKNPVKINCPKDVFTQCAVFRCLVFLTLQCVVVTDYNTKFYTVAQNLRNLYHVEKVPVIKLVYILIFNVDVFFLWNTSDNLSDHSKEAFSALPYWILWNIGFVQD